MKESKQLHDVARLIHLVEHRRSFTEFQDFVLKEKAASYKAGVEKAAGLAGHIVDKYLEKHG